MKKLVILVIALLAVAVPGVSAATVVKPDTVDSVFQNSSQTNWTISWNRQDGGALTIEETANVDGHTYQVNIEGTDNSVNRVSMIGWFEDMAMLDGGMFSEGLDIYNDLYNACSNFLPDDEAIYIVFNSYDIYNAVREGSSYFEGEVFDNWELLPTQPGRLAMRGSYGMLEAERLKDGRFWFAVIF